MRTIQMTIDEGLLHQVDEIVGRLGMSRSAFIRQSLEKAIRQFMIAELEKRHREGYLRHPVQPDEFDVWEAEQDWENI